jgi:transposase
MSTRFLYHEFGIRSYQHRRMDHADGMTVFHIEQPPDKLRCPNCGTANVTCQGSQERVFRSLPIGRRPTLVYLAVARVQCAKCEVTRQVRVPFADGKRRHTRAFDPYALELTRHMTIKDVANHLGVGWDLAKGLRKEHLERQFRQPKLRYLKRLAIDEIHVGRSGQVRTLVLDLDTGAIVFVGTGKGTETLQPFWNRLNSSRAKIQAVAADLSPAYTRAVVENLPTALLVYDRFHVVKLFHEKLADLRRDLYREAIHKLDKQVLKGTRWLLLKNPENLDNDKGEARRLEEALALNKSLATAYYLKEDLRQFWEQADRQSADRFLNRWIRKAEASGIRMLMDFTRTLAKHRHGLLNWYVYPISTGLMEGTNNQIRALSRQACGFRDHHDFELQLYALHTTRYLLVG